MNSLWVILFLNEFELICLHTGIAIACAQLNGFKCCYITQLIQFINHYLSRNEVVSNIASLLVLFVYI